MLDAFASALEVRFPFHPTLSFDALNTWLPLQMFDLLDATPSSNPSHILRNIIHVAAYPPDNARNPVWNVDPDLDHLSWNNLPQELRKVRTQCGYTRLTSLDLTTINPTEEHPLFEYLDSAPSSAGEIPCRGM